MKEVYYVYNNEAIASCIFLSVLDRIEAIDIARSCLILPFLLDDRTVSFMKRIEVSETNLEQIVNGQPRLFASFNKRYLSLLPVAINALIILNKGDQIYVHDNIVGKRNIDMNGMDLGDRFSKVQEVMPGFLSLLEDYSTEQLYRILKVQL